MSDFLFTSRNGATSCYPTTTRHPEFISGSNEILRQVQHDESGEIMNDLVNTVRPEPVARNTVRPEPVEGQGGVVHASTSSARTAKILDQKRLTDLAEGQVMRSYCDSLGEILKQVQHDDIEMLKLVEHDEGDRS